MIQYLRKMYNKREKSSSVGYCPEVTSWVAWIDQDEQSTYFSMYETEDHAYQALSILQHMGWEHLERVGRK